MIPQAIALAIEAVDDTLRVLTITSKNRRERAIIRENFDANYNGEQKNDYDIIVTTEVLAEGINLHRANTILNYDTSLNAACLYLFLLARINVLV